MPAPRPRQCPVPPGRRRRTPDVRPDVRERIRREDPRNPAERGFGGAGHRCGSNAGHVPAPLWRDRSQIYHQSEGRVAVARGRHIAARVPGEGEDVTGICKKTLLLRHKGWGLIRK
eukprot:gene16483-biopygen12812